MSSRVETLAVCDGSPDDPEQSSLRARERLDQTTAVDAFVEAFLSGLQLGKQLLQGASRQYGKQYPACSSFTDLPAPLIDHIIALADSDSRLALFSTNSSLRDAVLGHVASDAVQLRTRLRLHTDVKPIEQGQEFPAHETCANDQPDCPARPGLGAGSASQLLKLAARSAHAVHLSVCSSFTLDQALQKLKGTQSTSSSSYNSSNNGYGKSSSAKGVDGNIGSSCSATGSRSNDNRYRKGSSSSAQSGMCDHKWLSAVLRPFLHRPSPALSLQHVTTIWLQDMMLHHPMPHCIGDACPGLRCYGLHNVVWPSTTVARCWPQLQQLTLSDVYDPGMTALFNPHTLPQLSNLSFAWTGAFYEAQRAACWKSSWQLGYVIQGLSNQLTALLLEGFTWPCVMFGTLDTVCPKITSLCYSHQLQADTFFQCISRTVPNAQHLCIGGLCLQQSYKNRIDCTWKKLQHLHIDIMQGDIMGTLARLPPMPSLRVVTLPPSIIPTDVVVGTDWLADIAKVLETQWPAVKEQGSV